MMEYRRIWMPSFSASFRAVPLGRTWKPMMMASEADASRTSLSEIWPSLVDDVDLHLLGGELEQAVGQGFGRTVHVALDDEVELLEFTHRDPAAEFLEGDLLLRPDALFTLQLLALLGNGPGFPLAFKDVEFVTSIRGAVQSENRNGGGGSGFFELFATLVGHGADLAAVLTLSLIHI